MIILMTGMNSRTRRYTHIIKQKGVVTKQLIAGAVHVPDEMSSLPPVYIRHGRIHALARRLYHSDGYIRLSHKYTTGSSLQRPTGPSGRPVRK